MNHTTSSMTEGSIWKKITFFALPLFMSSLFQQLYNVADSLIVGNFLGSDALAAVSSSGSVIFLLTVSLPGPASLLRAITEVKAKRIFKKRFIPH